jgi:hypothetical protein
MEQDHIEFYGKIGKWVAVKKLKMDENTEPLEVVRFLASVHDSTDRKIWEFLGKEIDLEALDKIAYGITEATYNEKKKEWRVAGRISEEKLNKIMARLKNSGRLLENIAPTKNGNELAKVYLTRMVFDLIGMRIEVDPKIAEKYQKDKAKGVVG